MTSAPKGAADAASVPLADREWDLRDAPSGSEGAPAHQGAVGVAALVGVAMLGAFALLARDHLDAGAVRWLAEPPDAAFEGRAPVIGPLIDLARRWFGLPGFTTLRWTSAVCAALALGLAFLTAARLESTRRRALILTGVVASLPATWFAGTMATDHGPGILAIAVAFWLAAGFAARPSPVGAALLGVVTAAASWAHVTAVCLPLSVAIFLWIAQRVAGRPLRLAVHLPVLVAVHFAALLVGGALWASSPAPLAYLLDVAAGSVELTAGAMGEQLHKGWVRCLMPVSVVLLPALLHPTMRRYVIGVLVGALVLAVVTDAQMELEHRKYWTGFVLWQLALPVALLTVHWRGEKTCGWIIGIGAVVGVLAVLPWDGDPATVRNAAGLREVRSEQPTVILWSPNEFDSEVLLVRAPEVVAVNLVRPLAVGRSIGLSAEQAFDAGYAATSKGEVRVVITWMTMRILLESPAGSPLRSLASHLERRYSVRFLQRGEFRGFVVERR